MVLALQLKASYMRFRNEKLEEATLDEKKQGFNEVSRLLWISNGLSLFQVYN
jgi:hypothetical protein